MLSICYFLASKSQNRRATVDLVPSCYFASSPSLYPLSPRLRPLQQFSLLIFLKTGSQVKLSASSVLYIFPGLIAKHYQAFLLSYRVFVLGTTEELFQLKFYRVQRIYPENENSTCWLYKDKCIFVARNVFSKFFLPHVLQVVWLKFKLRKNKSIREGLLVIVLKIICFFKFSAACSPISPDFSNSATCLNSKLS